MKEPQPTTIAQRVSDLWQGAWIRELGLDKALTYKEQSDLYMLLRQADALKETRERLEGEE